MSVTLKCVHSEGVGRLRYTSDGAHLLTAGADALVKVFDVAAGGGLRVHRGYQDFGSYDTYEFQLQCLPERELREDGPVVHAGVLAELAARLPGVDVRAALTALLAQQRDGGKDEL